ncbi:MAG: hypothetical protein JWP97_3164 [Labilithrix sp.]|nr:hypothetical protein [Labilithrix sp.]
MKNALGFALLLTACGRIADTPEVVEPPVTLESSPWVISFVNPPAGPRTLRADRFVASRVESVVLEASAVRPLGWSPDGTWFAYESLDADGLHSVSLRRLSGDVWGEAKRVLSLPAGGSVGVNSQWSKHGPHLLIFDRHELSTNETYVVTLESDGRVTSLPLPVDSAVDIDGPVWSPVGERLVLGGRYLDGSGAWLEVCDLARSGPHDDFATDRVRVPAGSVPTGSVASSFLTTLADRAISPDGRWLVSEATATALDSHGLPALPREVVVSLDGLGTAREVPGCESSGDAVPTSSTHCQVSGWLPGKPRLLVGVYANGDDLPTTLVAWSPDDDSRLVIEAPPPGRWLAPHGGTRYLSAERRGGAAIVDLADPAKPVVVPVPTSELPSFHGINVSPDQGWLVVLHERAAAGAGSVELVDVRGEPPFDHRPIALPSGNRGITDPVWSASSAFFVLDDPADTRKSMGGLRVEAATGVTRPLAIDLGPVPSNFVSTWEGRLSPDDRLLVTARGGSLALQPLDAPSTAAAPLGEVPEWATPSWSPRHVP